MFGDQAIRLIRERWANPTMLAEEIFAILSSTELPLTHNGPVTLNGDSSKSPLTINNYGDAAPITITNSGGTHTIDVNENGNLTVNGSTAVVSGGGGSEDSSGGNVIAAKITSGSGATYTVALYANGRGAASTGSVSATHPDIDSGEDIPDDTPCWVMQNSAGAYEIMGIPTWLE